MTAGYALTRDWTITTVLPGDLQRAACQFLIA
jgi:hypothetical protein